MKNTYPYFFKASVFFIAVTLLSLNSCESDDSSNGSQNNFEYFPLTIANSWDYNVTTETVVVNDALEVSSNSGTNFELTSTPTPANALMTGVLSNGTLTASNGKLLGSGNLDFNFQGIDNLNINVQGAALYDQNASPNTTLSTTTGNATQSVQGFNLNINYTATTIQLASMPNKMVEGTTYNDVIHSQLIVNASINTPVTVAGFTTTVDILQPQDVFVVDNYWAKDVGLIQSDSQFSYELVDLSSFNISLPIDQNVDVLTVQTLTNYTIN